MSRHKWKRLIHTILIITTIITIIALTFTYVIYPMQQSTSQEKTEEKMITIVDLGDESKTTSIPYTLAQKFLFFKDLLEEIDLTSESIVIPTQTFGVDNLDIFFKLAHYFAIKKTQLTDPKTVLVAPKEINDKTLIDYINLANYLNYQDFLSMLCTSLVQRLQLNKPLLDINSSDSFLK